MDDACGVHCVFMALLGLGIATRASVHNAPPQLMRRDAAKTWRRARKSWFSGLLVQEIEWILDPMSRLLYIEKTFERGNKAIQFTLRHLCYERLVIIGICNSRKDLYHWVLALGYGIRKIGNREWADRLYVLDPQKSVWPMSLWNGEIDLRPSTSGSRMRWWKDGHGMATPVVIDEAIAIGMKRHR